MSGERFHFFAHASSPLSQWYAAAPFVLDGIGFKTAENYMMWRKGVLFCAPQAMLDRIIAASPADAKALGRRVPNFSAHVWSAHARPIVMDGNRAKFGQNPEAMKALMATHGHTLVEAAPWDTVWGIGLAAKDPRAANRQTWRGTNWLGEVLTNLRHALELQAGVDPDANPVDANPVGGMHAR